MKTTPYFSMSVMARRLISEGDDLVGAHVPSPYRCKRMGAFAAGHLIPEVDKYLRVVTEPDGETVHNAFFDRRFTP